MIDLDRELRALLAEEAHRAPQAPDARETIRRTRLRQLGAVLAALAMVAAIAVGSIAGVSALIRSSERDIPAGPIETPSPVVSSALDGYTATSFPAVLHMNDLAIAPDGTVWAAGPELATIARFDGETWTTYSTDDGLPHGWVWTLEVAPDGTVWAGTREGLVRLDGDTWSLVSPPEVRRVSEVAFAPDGSIVVAHSGRDWGIVRFDGATWSSVGDGDTMLPEELRSFVACLDVSPVDGSVWACAGGGGWVPFRGVWRLNGSGWTSWLEEGWSAPADLTVHPDGTAWLLVEQGARGAGMPSLVGFVGGKWTGVPHPTTIPAPGGILGPMVIGPDGTIWFVAPELLPAYRYPDSLFSFDGSSWTVDRLDSYSVTALDVGPDGALWVATIDPYSLVRFAPTHP